MPRRREGPTKNKATEYFYFDEYIGFPPDKRRIRFSLRTKDLRMAQKLWRREYERQWDIFYGIEKRKNRLISFKRASKEYIAYERDIKKIKSWLMYKQRLSIIQNLWNDISIHEIEHRHFIQLDQFLKSKKRSKKTINHYFTLLHGLFNYIIKKYNLSMNNPIDDVKPYVTDRKRREYTPEEITKILKAAERIEKEAPAGAYIMLHAKRIILMLLYTAMRPGELFRLEWKRHIKENRIILERSETKQKKEKVIPITDSIREVLDSLYDEKSRYVFPLRRDQNRKRIWGEQVIKKIREYTGIKDFIFYNLKHTAASIMVSQALGRGASLTDVMKILGHSQLNTTMQYVHSDFKRMKRAMKALEEAVENISKS